MADNYSFLDAGGQTLVKRAEEVGGVLLEAAQLTDPSGEPVYISPAMTATGFQPNGAEQRLIVQDAPPYSAAAFPADTTHVMYSVSGDTVLVRFDGTNPGAAGWGHILPAGENGVLPVAMAEAAKFAKGNVSDAAIVFTPLK